MKPCICWLQSNLHANHCCFDHPEQPECDHVDAVLSAAAADTDTSVDAVLALPTPARARLLSATIDRLYPTT